MLERPHRDGSTRDRIASLDPHSEQFLDLVEESRREGYWMLVRLADGWECGRNRFSRRGEAALAAWHGGELAGVCGLNVDPYVESRRQGRLRHLYVAPRFRRLGFGRKLVWAVIDRARVHFPLLSLRAPEQAFPFYDALGFERVEDDPYATHRMRLAPLRGGYRHVA